MWVNIYLALLLILLCVIPVAVCSLMFVFFIESGNERDMMKLVILHENIRAEHKTYFAVTLIS